MADDQQGSIDQFVESEINAFFSTPMVGQTKRYRAFCKIIVNGNDVTDRLEPFLISVTTRNGLSGYEPRVELDDRDGRLDIPPLNSPLEIWIGWTSEAIYQVFLGFVSDVDHGFGRRLGGRRMFILGTGTDHRSAVKSPMADHVGEGAPPGKTQGDPITFSQAFGQFASNAGLSAVVGPSFAGTVRDYWHMSNESIMNYSARMGSELGAFTWIAGKQIFFYGLRDFSSPALTAKWGDNLISWRIKPYSARSLWGGASQDFFDHVKGLWGNLQSQFNLNEPWSGASAVTKLPIPAPNSGVAQQQNNGDMQKASVMSGYGRVIINGEPTAQLGSILTIIGARPGVDGQYFTSNVIHTYSRQGFVTTLEISPNSGASTNNVGASGYSNSQVQQQINNQVQQLAIQNNQLQQLANPDGSITTFFPDGSETLTNALGTTTIKAPTVPSGPSLGG